MSAIAESSALNIPGAYPPPPCFLYVLQIQDLERFAAYVLQMQGLRALCLELAYVAPTLRVASSVLNESTMTDRQPKHAALKVGAT